MTTRFSDLPIALTARLSALLADDTTVVLARSYKRRMTRTEFEISKRYVSVYSGDARLQMLSRATDQEEFEIIVAIQEAGPEPSAKAGSNPFGAVTSAATDPIDWADQVLALVDRIKGFWRADNGNDPAGPLRNERIANCLYYELDHSPVYVPLDLEELGVLSSFLVVKYRLV